MRTKYKLGWNGNNMNALAKGSWAPDEVKTDMNALALVCVAKRTTTENFNWPNFSEDPGSWPAKPGVRLLNVP